ncbi:hypothetical protein T09_9410 [Trichinella sp. T9]|nr:hypothetical protein T09_9410 [Trichinella sp. T9]
MSVGVSGRHIVRLLLPVQCDSGSLIGGDQPKLLHSRNESTTLTDCYQLVGNNFANSP